MSSDLAVLLVSAGDGQRLICFRNIFLTASDIFSYTLRQPSISPLVSGTYYSAEISYECIARASVLFLLVCIKASY